MKMINLTSVNNQLTAKSETKRLEPTLDFLMYATTPKAVAAQHIITGQ